MKDDLPKAYTAYQQALYHLPNPKVSGVSFSGDLLLMSCSRNQSCGTVSVSSMTVMDLSSTLKRLSRAS
jgi:hypothetical protein